MHANVADGMGRKRQPEEVLPLLKRHEVQVLRRAGHSRAEVARLTGVAVRTIQRIDKEDEVKSADAKKETKRRGVGRPSKAEPFRAFIAALLASDPELLSVEILRRAKLKGYEGSKSALYSLTSELRPPKQRPIVRFEGLAGEFSQHDFGEVDVKFLDGTKKHIHFFASRLKYSRWVEVTLVPDERVESLVRPMVAHFGSMGGVPLVAVFDRPKTIVLRWQKDGTPIEWNATFAQVMLELGVGVELCWPRSGNQKGSVERLVGWVKNSFFKQRRFIDEEDLREQLAAWLVEANTKRVSRATGVVPESRMKEERARLRPLKVASAELVLRFPVPVGPTGFVVFEGRRYSMPPEALNLPATLYLYADRVRIVAGRHEAEHERLFGDNEQSVLPEHQAKMVAAVSGKRAKNYYKREQLLALGPEVVEYITELVHRKQRTWMQDIDTMFDALQATGADQTYEAIALALEAQTFGAEYVLHFLDPLQAVHRARSGRRTKSNGAAPAQLGLGLQISDEEEEP
jgi:transposase